jgi:D-alanyl-D-alanine carboxypeptidase
MASPQAALEGVERFITERLPRSDAPGVVVALTDREQLLGSVAVGLADVAVGRPVRPDDRFQIGSISKSFAAIIAMQEVEAGRLDLQAPVTDYVPWFEVRSPFAPITTHHVLTHTAGLIMGTDFGLDAAHQVWALRETECTYAPGERFFYSNDGYKLVGLILESVTGRSFPALLAERLLEPLGMAHSDPAITLETRSTVALPHQRAFDDRPTHPGQPWMVSPWYESATADGGIVSTAADMCAYARLLLAGGDAPGGRLFSEASWRRLSQRAVEDLDEPGAWYGYGLVTREVDGRTLIGHSGGMVGYSSYLLLDPEAGLAAVVLMNGNEDRTELVHYALGAGRAAAAGAPVPPPPPPADPTAVDDAEDLAGTYRLVAATSGADAGAGTGDGAGGPPGDRLTLTASSGRLLLRAGELEVTLERRGPDLFLAPHPDWDRHYLRAGRDAGGAVVELFHGPAWYTGESYAGPRDRAPRPEWTAFTGHYRSWSVWLPDARVFERRGRLLLSAPWLEAPGGEVELVPLDDAVFRVGVEEWRQDRLRFDAVVDGRATRMWYDQAAFYRAFTP